MCVCLPAAEIFKKDGRTMFTAKAFNGRVLTEWLARCLTNAAQHPDMYPDPEHQLDLLASCTHLGDLTMWCFSLEGWVFIVSQSDGIVVLFG